MRKNRCDEQRKGHSKQFYSCNLLSLKAAVRCWLVSTRNAPTMVLWVQATSGGSIIINVRQHMSESSMLQWSRRQSQCTPDQLEQLRGAAPALMRIRTRTKIRRLSYPQVWSLLSAQHYVQQRNHKPLYSHICLSERPALGVGSSRMGATVHEAARHRRLASFIQPPQSHPSAVLCCSFRAFDETVYARRASSHRKAALPGEWLPCLRPFSSTLASEWEPRTLRGFRTLPPRAETQFCFARCTLTRSAPLLRIR